MMEVPFMENLNREVSKKAVDTIKSEFAGWAKDKVVDHVFEGLFEFIFRIISISATVLLPQIWLQFTALRNNIVIPIGIDETATDIRLKVGKSLIGLCIIAFVFSVVSASVRFYYENDYTKYKKSIRRQSLVLIMQQVFTFFVLWQFYKLGFILSILLTLPIAGIYVLLGGWRKINAYDWFVGLYRLNYIRRMKKYFDSDAARQNQVAEEEGIGS